MLLLYIMYTKTDNMNNKGGFTLIEVVIAIMILAMCIGGLCQLFVNVHQLSEMSRSHYIAINIAKNKIERAKTLGYTDLYLLSENDGIVNSSGASDDPNGFFKVSTLVRPAGSNLMEIVVTVGIKSRIHLDFRGEQEEARTYMADIQF